MITGFADLAVADAEVLIVDDDADNRFLLKELLGAEDYRTVEATNGIEALERVAEHLPDAILLDVLMPGMDGLEVCRRLRADPRTAAVPVILVTAQRGREDRLAGIAAGASDFLTKPVDVADLRLRVRNAVATKRLYDRVEREYQRTKELEQHRDNLVHMLVHDLRSPLTGIVCDLQLLEHEGQRTLHPNLMECVSGAVKSAQVLSGMITSILDVNRLESGAMPLSLMDTDIVDVVREARTALGSAALRVRVENGGGQAHPTAPCDPELIRRVVLNLLSNAIDYSPPEEPVTVKVARRNGNVRIAVSDRGPGIPAEHHDRIFQKFGQVGKNGRPRKASSGLGLAFCQLAVEAHSGQIGIESEDGKGSTFWFELPVREVDSEPSSREEALERSA
ncbi:MAG: response regulator [Gemmatimonadota bacterium]|nr:response regulator [Gemmatimonadota bacterium]